MTALRLLSLCTGIGGIDYIWSNILGQEIAGQVEIDPHCQAVLQKQWSHVPKRADIREVKGDEFGPVDLVAGGIPCQPFSLSGRRRGTQDNRHLWPAAFAIVQRCRPTWVLIENVFGFVSLALDLVQTDLEGEGYTTQAYVLPACAVDAPHLRKRVFILAYTSSGGCGTWRTQCQGQQGPLLTDRGSASYMAHSGCDRCGERKGQQERKSACNGTAYSSDDGPQGDMAHPDSQRWKECNPSTGGNLSRLVTWGVDTDVAHPDSQRGPLSASRRDSTKQVLECTPQGQSQPGMGRGVNGLSDWLDSHRWPSGPNQPQEEWEPPRTVPHKIPYRAARLKALGNAIVPQQIFPFLWYIVQIERGLRA